MRELDFLPEWYPRARRRAHALRLQAWVALLIAGGLGTWLLMARHNVRLARRELAVVTADVAQSELELTHRRQQVELQEQLETQRQIVARLGLPVECSRLLRTLDAVMPREMSLVELSFDTEEQTRPTPTIPAADHDPGPAASEKAAASAGAGRKEPLTDRRLKVRMLAVAPSDVDLANFLTGLTNAPFFEQVSMTFSRDKSQDGHLMREFEVTFSMNLSHPVVAAAD